MTCITTVRVSGGERVTVSDARHIGSSTGDGSCVYTPCSPERVPWWMHDTPFPAVVSMWMLTRGLFAGAGTACNAVAKFGHSPAGRWVAVRCLPREFPSDLVAYDGPVGWGEDPCAARAALVAAELVEREERGAA